MTDNRDSIIKTAVDMGNMKIKVAYSNTGKTLSDIIENLVEKAEI